MNPNTPMKLTDVGVRDIERYLTDPDWVMQQKLDGARCQAVWDFQTETLWTNDGTSPIKFAAAKLALPVLDAEIEALMTDLGWEHARLDGELIPETGTYWVYDVVEASNYSQGVIVAPDDPLTDRLNVLGRLSLGHDHIRVSPTAYSEDAKREMWTAVVAAGVEGAVSKHVDSVYLPGTRTKEWVKHKLVKTADVEVVAARRTFKPNGIVETGSALLRVAIDPVEDPKPWTIGRKRLTSAEVYALPEAKRAKADYQPRTHLVVGNASLIGKDLEITEGSVVEVSFLYWSGEAMLQPRIMRLRTDKTGEECRLDQFATYSREVVGA